MSRLIVATIGFEEKFMIRAITRRGLDIGDKILLITGPPNEKSKNAISLIKDFIDKYYANEVSLLEKSIIIKDNDSFYDAVLAIKEILRKEAKGVEEVSVNLSGGMRVVILATLFALMLSNIKNYSVEIEAEDSSGLISLPQEALNLLTLGRRNKALELLRVINTGQVISSKEIAKKMGLDDSTVRRYLLELRKMKLIVARKKKPLEVEATALAKMFA